MIPHCNDPDCADTLNVAATHLQDALGELTLAMSGGSPGV